MLMPRYSLRSIFLATLVLAGMSYVVALAFRGTAWALCLSLAVGSIVIVLVGQAVMFAVVWCLAYLRAKRIERRRWTPALATAPANSAPSESGPGESPA